MVRFPYLRARFVIDGVVEQLVEHKADFPEGTKFYAEKNGYLESPFVHVHTSLVKSKRILVDQMQFTFMVQFICRIKDSLTSYEELEDIEWAIYNSCQIIYLPVAISSQQQGPVISEKKLPVRGYDMQGALSREDDYAELNCYIRYRLFVFRENPTIPYQKHLKVDEKIKEGGQK